MNKIFIGIDYSLKSPAVCIFNKGKYKWLSDCSKVEKPKREVLIQEDVESLNDVSMKYQGPLIEGTDYSSSDNANIINYREHSRTLVDMIISEFTKEELKNSEFHIGYEGYSFNSFSSSNNIIDIVSATTTFKNTLRDELENNNVNYTTHIYAPIKIKQFAGYSKFDKVDMFDVFTGNITYIKDKWSDAIDKDHEKKVLKNKPSVFKWNYKDVYLSGQFHSYCSSYEINRSVKKPKVPKPIDDMIDAYFVCCLLRDTIL